MSSSTTSVSLLLSPLRVGAWTLANRVVMAPLTRCRADPVTRVPWTKSVQYYEQRASAGLILTEATSVDPMGCGYPATPGIWSAEQVEGWKPITAAVHKAGGHIVLQLWHVGRISDPVYLPNGAAPVSSSAIAMSGHVNLLRPIKNFDTPRALETSELAGIVAAYKLGAENAKLAGFDGVELHAANGYLIEQFLSDNINHRQDQYGGSIENRARLLLEVVDALIAVWGADRVGVHLSPRGDIHDAKHSDPLSLFTYIARELGSRHIAFLFLRESRKPDSIGAQIKAAFGGVVIANEGFTHETAERALADGVADAVAFGKDIISNPDLVQRFRVSAPLNAWNASTFYPMDPSTAKEAGYIDYPTLVDASSTSASSSA